jgi:CRP-like cAMP-binding protein
MSHPNRILNSIPHDVFTALQPHLKIINLEFGKVIAESEQPVSDVYFPHLGIISLVVEMKVGDMIETAMVGRDGVVNATSALDGKISLYKGIVQAEGSASVINADILRDIADELKPFRSILIRHEQVLLAQAQQSAGCNASHRVEARMCRWLLRIRDLIQSDRIVLTQEFLSQMLGVSRTSVSAVASALQEGGLIKYARGHIQITDVEGLKSGTCECYEKVFSHYERLLTP